MKLGVLMTAYQEEEYIKYALDTIAGLADHVVVVEGAYQETIRNGLVKSPRSTDNTGFIIQEMRMEHDNISMIYANEESDPQQRTVGIQKLVEEGCDWCLIVDADEVWDEDGIDELRARLESLDERIMTVKLDIQVFVNDFWHYTWQTMSRCFRLKPDIRFIGDNETQYYKPMVKWSSPTFWHYAYVKNMDRFMLKKKWWATRGGSDWFVDENGQYHSPNHEIWEYKGEHPEIMKTHPYYSRKI